MLKKKNNLNIKTIIWEVLGSPFLFFILGIPDSEVSGLSVLHTTLMWFIAIGSLQQEWLMDNSFLPMDKEFPSCEPK